MANLRRYFLMGLLAIAPLAITLWILWQFYKLVNGAVRPSLGRIPGLLEIIPEFFLTLIGFVVFVGIITLIGRFTGNLLGRAFFGGLDRAARRIPLIKSIFAATKQMSEVFLGGRRSAFQQVVLFEYPRPGLFSLGFVTADYAGQPLVAVFLPTTPNPTSGFLLLIPRDQLTVLALSVEEGIRMIISGGAVMTRAQGETIAQQASRRLRREADDPASEPPHPPPSPGAVPPVSEVPS